MQNDERHFGNKARQKDLSRPQLNQLAAIACVSVAAKVRGSIPECIRNLKQLESVKLYENGLQGKVPPLPLESLKSIELQHNAFTGKFPSVEGAKHLRVARVSNNKLSRMGGFRDCPNLNFIAAEANSLQDLPALAGLPNLQFLDLAANAIRGNLSCLNVTDVSKLRRLTVAQNALSGTLPSKLLKLQFLAEQNL